MNQEEYEEIRDGELDTEEERGLPIWSIVGILVVAAAIGFVIYDGLKSETYFYSVDQALAQGTDLPGQRVRVKGIVEPGSIEGKDGELGRRFRISENGRSLKVAYSKAMPDTFEENREVVVLGEVADDMTLEAEEVLVKCPSRYEGDPPTAEEQQQPQASL